SALRSEIANTLCHNQSNEGEQTDTEHERRVLIAHCVDHQKASRTDDQKDVRSTVHRQRNSKVGHNLLETVVQHGQSDLQLQHLDFIQVHWSRGRKPVSAKIAVHREIISLTGSVSVQQPLNR